MCVDILGSESKMLNRCLNAFCFTNAQENTAADENTRNPMRGNSSSEQERLKQAVTRTVLDVHCTYIYIYVSRLRQE